MAQIFLWCYLLCVLLHNFSEKLIIRGSVARIRWIRDWTLWPIVVPYALTIALPLVEYLNYNRRPAPLQFALGLLLFVCGSAVRLRGLIDLGEYFSPFIDLRDGQRVVEHGIYRHIRHPLYLGVILIFVALPLMLGAVYTWLAALTGIAALLNRLYFEEKFLVENLPGYRAYKQRTSALIPGIF